MAERRNDKRIILSPPLIFVRIIALAQMVQALVNDECASIFCFGPPGTGKTYVVTRILRLLRVPFLYEKSMTLYGFYHLVRENPFAIIVLDEFDTWLDQIEFCNALKAATDGSGRRLIKVLNRDTKRDKITEIEFYGKVIILSNYSGVASAKMRPHIEAVREHCRTIELPRSREELLKFLDYHVAAFRYFASPEYVATLKGAPPPGIQRAQNVLDFLHANINRVGVIGFRFLHDIMAERINHPADWSHPSRGGALLTVDDVPLRDRLAITKAPDLRFVHGSDKPRFFTDPLPDPEPDEPQAEPWIDPVPPRPQRQSTANPNVVELFHTAVPSAAPEPAPAAEATPAQAKPAMADLPATWVWVEGCRIVPKEERDWDTVFEYAVVFRLGKGKLLQYHGYFFHSRKEAAARAARMRRDKQPKDPMIIELTGLDRETNSKWAPTAP